MFAKTGHNDWVDPALFLGIAFLTFIVCLALLALLGIGGFVGFVIGAIAALGLAAYLMQGDPKEVPKV